MNRIMLARIFLTLAVVLSAFAAFPEAASAQPAGNMSPVQLQFDKQGGVNGIWHGTVNGDVTGDLTTVLTSASQTGQILQVTFDWIIDAGPQSFTARLKGTLNLNTGAVEMDGTVVDGWLDGAQVHEEGQLVDPATGRFQGRILIFPATAG